MKPGWRTLQLTVLLTAVSATSSHAANSFNLEKDYLAPAREWPAWQQTLDRQQREMAAMHRCTHSSNPGETRSLTSVKDRCGKRTAALNHLVRRSAALKDRQKIDLVNRYVNRHRYRRDHVHAGAGRNLRNSWQTLNQFLRRGGDCEDYASAKYFILREMGFRAKDLRIVVGWERANRSYHSLLAIMLDSKLLFLDSDNTIKRLGSLQGYRFTFSLNEFGIWDHRPGTPGTGST